MDHVVKRNQQSGAQHRMAKKRKVDEDKQLSKTMSCFLKKQDFAKTTDTPAAGPAQSTATDNPTFTSSIHPDPHPDTSGSGIQLQTTDIIYDRMNLQPSHSADPILANLQAGVVYDDPSNNPSQVDWLSSVGKLKNIRCKLSDCKDILLYAEESDCPDPRKVLTDINNFVQELNLQCEILKEEVTNSLIKITSKDEDLADTTKIKDQIEHDPGKCEGLRFDSFQRKQLIELGPCQPRLFRYPVATNLNHKKQCSFSSTWFNEYPHLEYSVSKDAAFCFVCRLFSEGPDRQKSDPAWYQTGVKTWHKMKSVGKNKLGKLAQHFASQAHKAALGDYCHFVQYNSHIEILLDKDLRKQKVEQEAQNQRNLNAIHVLMDIARFLCRQGIAFRGADLDSNGNFVQLTHLVARHSPNFLQWMNECKKRSHHVTYLSPKCQNEFIDILGNQLCQTVISQISKSEMYSIIADTTPDSSNKDMLSIVVRYVQSNGEPVERLLSISEAINKTGDGLSDHILGQLNANQLDLNALSFQSYDFASSMSGCFKGTQAKLSEKIGRHITYIPCQAHRCNTFVEHSCSSSLIIAELFNVLEELYVFFNASTKRYLCLSSKLIEVENSLHLRNLSKTRWTASAESLRAVWTSYEQIIEALQSIIDGNFDNNAKVQASGLAKKLYTFDFICPLTFMRVIMYKMKILTENLQAVNLNIFDAMTLTKSCIDSLKTIRANSDEQDNLISSAAIFSEKLGIDVNSDFKKSHRLRRKPTRFDSNSNTQIQLDFREYYRKEFSMVLDSLITEMSDNMISCISKLEPLSLLQPPVDITKCTLAHCETLSALFPPNKNIDFYALQAELEVFLRCCAEKMPQSTSEIAQLAEEKRNIFPLSNMTTHLMLTSPVTVASGERSFSKLKLIKNALRSSMADERMQNMLRLSAEKDLTDELNMKDAVREWGSRVKRRIVIA